MKYNKGRLNDFDAYAYSRPRRGSSRAGSRRRWRTARAGNRRFSRLSARRAHTKPPYKPDLTRETLRPLKRPWRARTVAATPILDSMYLVKASRVRFAGFSAVPRWTWGSVALSLRKERHRVG